MAQVAFGASMLLLAVAWGVSKFDIPGKSVVSGCAIIGGGLAFAAAMLIAAFSGQLQ